MWNPSEHYDLQTITVYYGYPMYMMSPRIKLYRPDQIVQFKGYLSSFEPQHMDFVNDQPETTLTIGVTNDASV